MKCLNCGNEMQQGIVEGYGQGGHSCYEYLYRQYGALCMVLFKV